eukprot:GDKJ01041741.1.p1 GENE.GDKJ01041741.1~~GDKJ01041741.1.p1  ORF type:complete len:323 (-),score=57.51 GDKJ01041741.1:125-1036(-)
MKSLHSILKSRYGYIIEPWMIEASPKHKRDMCSVGEIVSKTYSKTYSAPVQSNTNGLLRPVKNTGSTIDRAQVDRFKTRTAFETGIVGVCRSVVPSGKIHEIKDQCSGPRHLTNNAELKRFFNMDVERADEQIYSFLLNPVAKKRLNAWQAHDATRQQKAAAVAVLNSLFNTFKQLPNYQANIESHMHNETAWKRCWTDASEKNHLKAGIRTQLYSGSSLNGFSSHAMRSGPVNTFDPVAQEIMESRMKVFKERTAANLQSHLCFPWRGQGFQTTYMRDFQPNPEKMTTDRRVISPFPGDVRL